MPRDALNQRSGSAASVRGVRAAAWASHHWQPTTATRPSQRRAFTQRASLAPEGLAGVSRSVSVDSNVERTHSDLSPI